MLTHTREDVAVDRARAEDPGGLRPRRILHVLARMDRGGIETSLMELLRTIDRQRYHMDFLALSEQPGAQDEDIRALGSRITVAPASRRPWLFARHFKRIVREHGPYDVIHSHVHFYGGYVLRLALRQGIPLRIAHSRNDTRVAEQGRGWPRRCYVWLMRRWVSRYANFRIAISRTAAEDLFGDRWQQDDRFRMIYSGRDFSPYALPRDRAEVRASLGLPADAFVLGHVGRFYWRKNHRFVIEVAAALLRHEPRVWLLLVGDGPRQGEIEAFARDLGIADRVIFTGACADVPRLLRGAMDAYVFPSHHEGLGMAVVEAQAAGLPCVIASTMPEEIDVVPGLIHRLPLSAPADVWAERILEAASAPRPSPEEALRAVCASDFEVQRSLASIQAVYDMAGDDRPAASRARAATRQPGNDR
ncbi:MAG: glycosyltransferase [Geminicoccaceae bacterium]